MSAAIKAAKRGGRAVAQGDPGLFGGIRGAVTGFGKSFISGGNPFAGAARGAVTGFRGAPTVSAAGPSISMALPPGRPPGPGGVPIVSQPGVKAFFEQLIPGGRTGLRVGPSSLGTDLVPFVPKGFHPNKSDYFLRDGTFVAKGSKFVKNRRRNPLNPRALRRAISRIDAGKIWQGKLHEISTGKFTAAGNRKD